MIAAVHPRILASLSLLAVLWAPTDSFARRAAPPTKRPPTAAARSAAPPAPAPRAAPPATPTKPAPSPAATTPPPAGADVPKDDGDVTRYTFTGLDIDGELRTPALLQFLARIGGEFETVGIPHRSFMPELASTVAEDAL